MCAVCFVHISSSVKPSDSFILAPPGMHHVMYNVLENEIHKNYKNTGRTSVSQLMYFSTRRTICTDLIGQALSG